MRSVGWGVVFAIALGSSNVVLAEDGKPQPGVEMTLEQRGPCSVIECTATSPAEVKKIERELRSTESVLRIAHPRADEYRARLAEHYHRLFTERVIVMRRALDAINARLAACEGAER